VKNATTKNRNLNKRSPAGAKDDCMKPFSKTAAAVAIALSAVFTSAATAQDTAPAPAAAVITSDIDVARKELGALLGESRSRDPVARARAVTAAADYAAAHPTLEDMAYHIATGLLNDKEDGVRIATMTTLGRLGMNQTPAGTTSIAILGQILNRKTISPAVRVAAIDALGVAGSTNKDSSHIAYTYAAPGLKHTDATVRHAAIEAAGAIAAVFPQNRVAYNTVNNVGLLLGDTDPAVSTAAKAVVTKICTANTNLNCPPIP
jgi:hypothetical protein